MTSTFVNDVLYSLSAEISPHRARDLESTSQAFAAFRYACASGVMLQPHILKLATNPAPTAYKAEKMD